ncbi:MAG: YfhO family protein [bacterium]
MMNLDKKDLWLIFLFLTLIILFFGQVLFTPATYVIRDFYRTFYPTRYFVAECVKEGFFPLWNPYLYCGHPFFASLQHGLLNPFSFFIYLFPFDIGIKLFIVWHFFLAGLFMYLLMRDFDISGIPSLIAACAYTFNSYMLSIDTFTHLTSACWTPLIFLLFNRVISSSVGKKFKYIILTGISLSLQFAGEKVEIFFATVIVLILWTLAKIILFKPQERKIAFFSLSLVGLISLGLILIQLLPFFEAVVSSYRTERTSYSQATNWSLPPLELFTLICPIKSGFMEFIHVGIQHGFFKGLYFGIVPLFLILITFYEKRKRNLFWQAIFLIGIILSLGNYTPFYKFLYDYLPLFSMFRYPVKFFCISIFAGSILAGVGFEYLLKTIKAKKIKPAIVLFIPNLFLIFILLIWYLNMGKFLWLLKLHYFIPESIEELMDIEGKNFMIYQNFFLVTIVFSLFNLLVIISSKLRIKLTVFAITSTIIIIFDLIFFGLNLNPLVDQKLYHQQPEMLKILKKEEGYSRFMIEPKTIQYYSFMTDVSEKTQFETVDEMQLRLIPNFGLMHKIYEIEGYGFLILEDYLKFYERLISGEFTAVHQLLNLSNVQYILSKFEIPSSSVQLVYKMKKYGEEFMLYKNPDYLPRAFFVSKAKIVKNREKILNILTNKNFDPQKEVILEENVLNYPESKIQNFASQHSSNSKSKIQITAYQPNKVKINTSCQTNGFLFLSDTYYPGWKAYVDGQQTKIYRANFLFRAVVLPKGSHQVEFVYSPLSFKIGLLGSILTSLVLILIGLWKNRGYK